MDVLSLLRQESASPARPSQTGRQGDINGSAGTLFVDVLFPWKACLGKRGGKDGGLALDGRDCGSEQQILAGSQKKPPVLPGTPGEGRALGLKGCPLFTHTTSAGVSNTLGEQAGVRTCPLTINLCK